MYIYIFVCKLKPYMHLLIYYIRNYTNKYICICAYTSQKYKNRHQKCLKRISAKLYLKKYHIHICRHSYEHAYICICISTNINIYICKHIHISNNTPQQKTIQQIFDPLYPPHPL